MGYGTFYVAAKPSTRAMMQKAATDLGVSFERHTTAPTGPMSKLRKLRIGLVDSFGGSSNTGWTRLVLENFEFPFESVYPPMLDAGNLIAKYDVLVFRMTLVPRWRRRAAVAAAVARARRAATRRLRPVRR